MINSPITIDCTGQTKARTITDADLVWFGGVTGDYNQMHFDRHFAAAIGDGRAIAHGLLAASISYGQLAQQAPAVLAHTQGHAAVEHYSINYRRPVYLGDSLSTHWQLSQLAQDNHCVDFRILNQHNELCSDGSLQLNLAEFSPSPTLWPLDASHQEAPTEPWYFEDFGEHNPCQETEARTLTETDVVNYAALSGDYNPLSVDQGFAQSARFSDRTLQPLLCFEISFAAWLRELLAHPQPDAGFAGHINDQWQQFKPIYIGDTLRCRYKTLSTRRSNSQPDRGIVTFGLQLINQHNTVVQQASVLMMYPCGSS